jgi:putative addiction module CopG family antidote
MNVTLSAEFEKLVNDKLQAGEYRSADELVHAALRLFQKHEEAREVRGQVNLGEPQAADDRLHSRLEMLLEEAEEMGCVNEVTEQDWDDLGQPGTARIKDREPA